MHLAQAPANSTDGINQCKHTQCMHSCTHGHTEQTMFATVIMGVRCKAPWTAYRGLCGHARHMLCTLQQLYACAESDASMASLHPVSMPACLQRCMCALQRHMITCYKGNDVASMQTRQHTMLMRSPSAEMTFVTECKMLSPCTIPTHSHADLDAGRRIKTQWQQTQ